MNIFVFDIETIPDIELAKKIYSIDEPDDKLALELILKTHQEKHPNSTFLPHFLHKIVAISIVLQSNSNFKIWSLGEMNATETELLKRFFDGITQFNPTIVSWNGTNYDLPVIQYRALKNSVPSKKYWDCGKHDPGFKWNNYLNRYHERHCDLMDVLAGFSRANASLQNISIMLGLPGKMGIDGSQVYSMYKENKLQEIRDYCEIDVLNTYLVFLKFELIRHNIDNEIYESMILQAKTFLENSNKEHFQKYLNLWK